MKRTVKTPKGGLVLIGDARFLVAVFCLMAVIGGSGGRTAMADSGNQPHTDPVAGSFSFTTVQVKQRSCTGQDGAYLEITARQVGAAVGDPRLTGDLELTSNILLNASTGLGTSEGRFTVRDTATGRKKAEGEFHGVITLAALSPSPLFGLHGMLLGKVFDEGTGTDEELLGRGRALANFEATFDAHLNGTGQFGGAGDILNPSVIQGGHCTGPVTTTP